MDAEHYIHEKERLSQAMGGRDRLMEAVADITEALEKHRLDRMPGVALDKEETNCMRINIKGEPKEIVALVVGLQGQQGLPQDSADAFESRLLSVLKKISEGYKEIQYS